MIYTKPKPVSHTVLPFCTHTHKIATNYFRLLKNYLSHICDGCCTEVAFCLFPRAVVKGRNFSPLLILIITQKQRGLKTGKCGWFITSKMWFITKNCHVAREVWRGAFLWCMIRMSYNISGFYAEWLYCKLSEIRSKYRKSLSVLHAQKVQIPQTTLLFFKVNIGQIKF